MIYAGFQHLEHECHRRGGVTALRFAQRDREERAYEREPAPLMEIIPLIGEEEGASPSRYSYVWVKG